VVEPKLRASRSLWVWMPRSGLVARSLVPSKRRGFAAHAAVQIASFAQSNECGVRL